MPFSEDKTERKTEGKAEGRTERKTEAKTEREAEGERQGQERKSRMALEAFSGRELSERFESIDDSAGAT